MFHKISEVYPLDNYRLSVKFSIGITKIYDCNPLFNWKTKFNDLKDKNLFDNVYVDIGGCGIVFNDDLDLSCEELWENGIEIKTPFDGLISMSDATSIWGLNESTLRKAIAYGKLVKGVDVCKYGKQWVISTESLKKIYGIPEK